MPRTHDGIKKRHTHRASHAEMLTYSNALIHIKHTLLPLSHTHTRRNRYMIAHRYETHRHALTHEHTLSPTFSSIHIRKLIKTERSTKASLHTHSHKYAPEHRHTDKDATTYIHVNILLIHTHTFTHGLPLSNT